MTEEDEEFQRIERESGWRKRQVQKVIEDDDDVQDYKKPWVGLISEDMKDERTHNFDFINGARWAEKILKERNT
jgi:hypothetical protein